MSARTNPFAARVVTCARADDMIADFVKAFDDVAALQRLTRAFRSRWGVRTLLRVRRAADGRVSRSFGPAAGVC